MRFQLKVFNKTKFFLVFLLPFLGGYYFFNNLDFGYTPNVSSEMQLHSTSYLGQMKSKAIAASCGFTLHGSADEFNCSFTCPDGRVVPGTRTQRCGGTCNPNNPCPCTNGATNPPTCSICPTGTRMVNNRCICNNGANNPTTCDRCPTGQNMQNNICVCSNGATNPPACDRCPAGASMVNNRCVCNNGGDISQSCVVCLSGQDFDNTGYCRNTCSTTNVCGQRKTGLMINNQCVLSSGETDPNSSCILEFNFSSDVINPNGSVEFSWKLGNLPANIRPRCKFVDLTTPVPRDIPGLGQLDPTLDRVRINNIQTTTRFCLVCRFFNTQTSQFLPGEAARHQWVRVIRIGEN